MLTEKERELLEQVFVNGGPKKLSLQRTGEIAKQATVSVRAVEWFALDKGVVPGRYQRNIGSLGIEGQKKLLESKVVVVGLGGLGGQVVEELTRVGVGRIVGVDKDVFEESNLNRQLFAEESNLGKEKAAEVKGRIERINRAVEFEGLTVSLEELGDEVWCDAGLVFDCLDNIEDRLVLAKRCSMANVPLVHGAIAGWYGEVGVIWPGTEMLEKIYRSQKSGIEQDIGTPPFTAAVAASLMVAKGIRILTGKNVRKERKMLFFDLLEDEWQRIVF